MNASIIIRATMSFGVLLTVFLLVVIGERLYERRFHTRAERGVRKMEWSFMALHTLYMAVLVGSAAECFWWPRPMRPWLTGIGLGLFVVSLVVRLVAIRTLGQFWSLDLEIRPEHRLVTDGIYRHVRHPAYSAIMLEVVSIPMAFNAYGTLALAVFVYVPLLLWRWSREEREMIDKFGDRYVQYRKEVPAFLPWPHRW